ncbi:hypothetical protein FHR36_007811 [Kitasatospora paracochleata]|uniref:SAM-dependent methyltransferase n=1 Tax=Kitasatospora paracochleata TaxID=58354 RepID=A0ABT1JAZ2_9ACTN|nr:hypothetical protein [Kitasatospora paracochleata]
MSTIDQDRHWYGGAYQAALDSASTVRAWRSRR